MLKIKILSWNVRGINSSLAKRNLREVTGVNKANIVCIQETKSEHVKGKQLVFSSDNFGAVYQPSVGLSGGLATFWSLEFFKCLAIAQNRNWIWITLNVLEDGSRVHIINVYSPLALEGKRLLWRELRDIFDCIQDEAACFVGDFNCVRGPGEKKNCEFRRIDTLEFNNFLLDCNLLEARVSNASFTWIGPDEKKSMLDRVFLNAEWFKGYTWQVKALCRKHSDHKPLLLFVEEENWGPKPYKIFNCHLNASLKDEMLEFCKSNSKWGKANIHQSLKLFKHLVKSKVTVEFQRMNTDIKDLENRRHTLEELEGNSGELQAVRERLSSLYSLRDSMLRQKARLTWINSGDSNTKFFHQVIQRRRNKNSIKRIYRDSVWYESPKDIKRVFFEYFSDFFKQKGAKLLGLGSLLLPALSDSVKNLISRPFSRPEVEMALSNLADSKAPGPDGLNIKCIKFLWPFICSKVMSFIDHFYASSSIPSGINSSFIALIPKVVGPRLVKDFRPISLLNSCIKILLKVLATRLAGHMNSIISESQSGFIKGRQASESILIVKEVVHSIQRRKCKGLILKLDFEKAFDSVRWDFLLEVLETMNFGSKWCSWIKGVLTSTRISVLVNGSPTAEFSPERGLRQGDPISPLLYNIVAEVLSVMLTSASNKGIFKGIALGNSSNLITHLQYADDTIVFIEDSMESIQGVKRVLQSFQLLSGLKINFDKSTLYSSKSSEQLLVEGAELLKCKKGSWPLKYLGINIGMSSKRICFWKPLMDRFKQKLASWKLDSLNQAGRVTLVKSVMDSLPVHWFNLHLLPASVLEEIEKTRRNFIWGHSSHAQHQEKKMHLVSWQKICRPKSQGGLGLVPIRARNIAMLGKWSYKWTKDRNKRWNIWLRDKYNCGVHTSMVEALQGKHLSGTMSDILKAITDPVSKQSLAQSSFPWKVRNGESVFFWEDYWFENKCLKFEHKRLYQLSTFKESTVAMVHKIWLASSLKSEHLWTRQLRSWESEEVSQLEEILKKLFLSKDDDQLIWETSKAEYSVKLAANIMSPCSPTVNWEFIWKLRVPHKIKIFLWKLHLNILPTKTFLSARGIILAKGIMCEWCSCSEETTIHLLIECPQAKDIWKQVFSWWLMPHFIRHLDSINSLWNIFKKSRSKKIHLLWRITVSATFWALWLLRNAKVFNSHDTSKEGLLAMIKNLTKEWSLAFDLMIESSLQWWNHNPVGSITFSESYQMDSLFTTGNSLVGFIDGSHKARSGQILSGMGGVILDSEKNTIFIFSGPVSSDSALEAEWQALKFTVQAFGKSPYKDRSLIIYSDCSRLVCKYLEITTLQGAEESLNLLVQNLSIKVKLIHRDLNQKADKLAKEGASRPSLIHLWTGPQLG